MKKKLQVQNQSSFPSYKLVFLAEEAKLVKKIMATNPNHPGLLLHKQNLLKSQVWAFILYIIIIQPWKKDNTKL